jgi:hypothetical protein
MSLWTPGGEVPVNRGGDQPSERPAESTGDTGVAGRVGGPNLDDLSPEERAQAEEMIAQMAEVQRQIVSAPASQVVANHVAGFYELAMLHLAQERPKFDEAQLAVDAMSAVLDAVEARLGENGPALRQALSQAQMVFVQVRNEVEGSA